MNRTTSLSNGARLNVAGLVVTAIGMLLEIGAGSELYPTLTGPIVLLLGAALVVFRPGRWTSYAGLIIPLVLAIGLSVSAVLSPTFFNQMVDTGNVGIVLGSALHAVGLIAGVAGGAMMVMASVRRPSAADHVR
jgi:hypothetical protein